MLGNVWEWCADEWHNSYDGAPTDGSAWVGGEGGAAIRVIRGGSWHDVARGVRAAYRYRYDPAVRYVYLGFRCARVPVVSPGRSDSGSRQARTAERAGGSDPFSRGVEESRDQRTLPA
jgi:hypothetical protein